jgi:adenosylcobyric acid synthase
MHGLYVEAEDALPIKSQAENATQDNRFQIIVPALPRISNHTDFDPLRLHPQVNLRFIGPGERIPSADLIIIPGSKSVRTDLEWLRKQGWEISIMKHLRYGGKIIGICGGFQMLGKIIEDPHGLEGKEGSSAGLGLFNMRTLLAPDKQIRNVLGTLSINHTPITGYEIHAGITTYDSSYEPAIYLVQGSDGAISPDGLIFGTYLHGLFESPTACTELLAWAGLRHVLTHDYPLLRERTIDRLADAIAQHIDISQLNKILNLNLVRI